MTHLASRIGEVVARAIMLGLIVLAGIFFAPVIAFWLIYNLLRRQPRGVEPEYHAIVE
jgi:hypothetical protein